MTETEAKLVNPVTLAFLGDAVYSLYVREKLVRTGGGKAADFQRTAAKIVSAKGQSEFLAVIEQSLTDEEADIFRWGRNAKKSTKAKHASVAEYNRSTGFEAVVGYLYLLNRKERLEELFAMGDESAYRLEERKKGLKP